MMIEEFEKRTGFYPTLVQYEAIERAYMDFDGDKDAFCKAYKKNADGMAERIQREVNMATFKAQRDQVAELSRRPPSSRVLHLIGDKTAYGGRRRCPYRHDPCTAAFRLVRLRSAGKGLCRAYLTRLTNG